MVFLPNGGAIRRETFNHPAQSILVCAFKDWLVGTPRVCVAQCVERGGCRDN
jgi:hypothetical protein